MELGVLELGFYFFITRAWGLGCLRANINIGNVLRVRVPWWPLMGGNHPSTWSNVRPESSTCPKQDERHRTWRPCSWGSSSHRSVLCSCPRRGEARSRVNALVLLLEARTWGGGAPQAIYRIPCQKRRHL